MVLDNSFPNQFLTFKDILEQSFRAFALGLRNVKCKENLTFRPKRAQHLEVGTFKNSNFVPILLQYHPKCMMVLYLNGMYGNNFLIHSLSFLIPKISLSSLIISLLFSLFLLSFSSALSFL